MKGMFNIIKVFTDVTLHMNTEKHESYIKLEMHQTTLTLIVTHTPSSVIAVIKTFIKE